MNKRGVNKDSLLRTRITQGFTITKNYLCKNYLKSHSSDYKQPPKKACIFKVIISMSPAKWQNDGNELLVDTKVISQSWQYQ